MLSPKKIFILPISLVAITFANSLYHNRIFLYPLESSSIAKEINIKKSNSDYFKNILQSNSLQFNCNTNYIKTNSLNDNSNNSLGQCLRIIKGLKFSDNQNANDNKENEFDLNERIYKEFYPELNLINNRLDVLEERILQFKKNQFSSTTSATFNADFHIGSVNNASSEATTFDYEYLINIKTSFKGNDYLSSEIQTGNSSPSAIGTLIDLNQMNNDLNLDSIYYTFPINHRITLLIGNGVDISKIFDKTCDYKGTTKKLNDCGTTNSNHISRRVQDSTTIASSIMIAENLSFGAGFSSSSSNTFGLFNKETLDKIATQISFNKNSWGGGISYSSIQTNSSSDSTFLGINSYWRPQESYLKPSISIGYELEESNDSISKHGHFIGLGWEEVGPGSLSIGLSSSRNFSNNEKKNYIYEFSYSYLINDGLTINPSFFVNEQSSNNQYGFLMSVLFKF
tara:strand:+ start:1151 stop:2515 length:1365 start_codon:yes stop_codon:yes gene_type:complete